MWPIFGRFRPPATVPQGDNFICHTGHLQKCRATIFAGSASKLWVGLCYSNVAQRWLTRVRSKREVPYRRRGNPHRDMDQRRRVILCYRNRGSSRSKQILCHFRMQGLSRRGVEEPAARIEQGSHSSLRDLLSDGRLGRPEYGSRESSRTSGATSRAYGSLFSVDNASV